MGDAGTQKALDAEHEVASTGRGGQIKNELWLDAEFLQPGEGGGIEDRIAADLHGGVITAVLALLANAPGEPPDGGVIEQQCFREGLNDIREEIPAADMGQFVGQQRL